MNTVFSRISAIVSSVFMLLIAGCGILNLLSVLANLFLAWGTFSIPMYIPLALIFLATTVAMLLYGFVAAIKKKGAFDLICSVLTLLIGGVWTVVVIVNWLFGLLSLQIIDILYEMSGDYWEAFYTYSDISSISYFLTIIVSVLFALYLVGVFLISVLRSKTKWAQLQAELVKPAVAALIAVPAFVDIIFFVVRLVVANYMGPDALIAADDVYCIVYPCIYTLLALACAVILLVAGLINLKKKPEKQPEEMPEDLSDDDIWT